MHSLEQLRRGELQGVTRLDLSAQLTEFPTEIFDLADSLEVLNLSGNQLRSLPNDLPRLRKLKVIFCSENPFTELPEVLGQCPKLEMIGFKDCQIEHVPPAALPEPLRWLILTGNRVQTLPSALGSCARMQKLMLAGNQLRELPDSLAQLEHLELLRLAANQLQRMPTWLAQLPRLSWLAIAGNPAHDAAMPVAAPCEQIPRQALQLGELLGQGASGLIYRAQWQRPGQQPRAMAVKLFKGQITSDGLPRHEHLASLAVGRHANLIPVVGALQPEAQQVDGLLMELIGQHYRNLAAPPSLASCTRDVYPANQRFTPTQVLQIALGAASAAAHLHQQGLMHGDLYAHNLLIDEHGHCLLGDFGAASFTRDSAFHRLETRAFGCLLEELLTRCSETPNAALWDLQQACVVPEPQQRPSLAEVHGQLLAQA